MRIRRTSGLMVVSFLKAWIRLRAIGIATLAIRRIRLFRDFCGQLRSSRIAVENRFRFFRNQVHKSLVIMEESRR